MNNILYYTLVQKIDEDDIYCSTVLLEIVFWLSVSVSVAVVAASARPRKNMDDNPPQATVAAAAATAGEVVGFFGSSVPICEPPIILVVFQNLAIAD